MIKLNIFPAFFYLGQVASIELCGAGSILKLNLYDSQISFIIVTTALVVWAIANIVCCLVKNNRNPTGTFQNNSQNNGTGIISS